MEEHIVVELDTTANTHDLQEGIAIRIGNTSVSMAGSSSTAAQAVAGAKASNVMRLEVPVSSASNTDAAATSLLPRVEESSSAEAPAPPASTEISQTDTTAVTAPPAKKYSENPRQRHREKLREIELERQARAGGTSVAPADVEPPSPPIDTSNESVSLVMSLWAEPEGKKNVHPHRHEVEAGIVANLCNIHLHQVVIVLDSAWSKANCTHFHKKMMTKREQTLKKYHSNSNHIPVNTNKLPFLTCIDRRDGQPTYYDMFHYSLSKEVTGTVAIMSNTDHVYDETVEHAKTIPRNGVWVIATAGYSRARAPPLLSTSYDFLVPPHGRFNKTTDDGCGGKRRTWDAYVFRKDTFLMPDGTSRLLTTGRNFQRRKAKGPDKGTYFYYFMNMNYVEFAALHDLIVGLDQPKVRNACKSIKAWHFHLAAKMHNKGFGERTVDWRPTIFQMRLTGGGMKIAYPENWTSPKDALIR